MEEILTFAPELEQILKHQGETRDDRLREFHAYKDDQGNHLNSQPVVALREGAMLRIGDGHVTLKGTTGARILTPGSDLLEYPPNSDLSFLLK